METKRSKKTHGESPGSGKPTPEYVTWTSMKGRCLNPKAQAYSYYGGRGITICERWMKYENFLADMGRRPSPLHSLDRRDNSKGYDASNCRWATWSEQMRNRRPRDPDTIQRGEQSGMAKLTTWKVRVIRRCVQMGMRPAHLGRIFGVSGNQCFLISERRAWAHVP